MLVSASEERLNNAILKETAKAFGERDAAEAGRLLENLERQASPSEQRKRDRVQSAMSEVGWEP